MVHFMIYLLETGICLSLLYLAYWLFLRKETYFNFNRIFLVGSIALSLLIPSLHMNIIVPRGSTLEHTATGIEKARGSYEEMIRLINADFGTEPGARHLAGGGDRGGTQMENGGTVPGRADQMVSSQRSISISKILLILYICGVFYFLARFVYLVVRLYLLAKRNRVTRQEGFRMVEIQEQISPFSFFRFLFINHGSFEEPELHQVLEHEKAHIMQRHSMDHLFAHILAVFQWFNPIAWQIRKALKTTHEYIADRQVIDRGVERIDYQSLLLKQVIGYHSVELVNNFNLKPIKKRIAMMNKTKSGIPARFKAALVAPFAILIFFLFADFTLKGTSAHVESFKELEGLWIKQTVDDFSETILVKDGVFSYPDGQEIRQYDMKSTEEGKMVLMSPVSPGYSGARGGSVMTYSLSGDELTFSWNPWSVTRYNRSTATNTLDLFLLKNQMKIDLPSISRYRLLEKDNQIYRIGIAMGNTGKTIYTVDGQLTSLPQISVSVNRVLGEKTSLDAHDAIGIFLVDQKVHMSEVVKAREELLEATRFHVAEGGYPHGDMELSPLLYHSVALPRLLPPKNAKILDKDEVEKSGGSVHSIDLSDRNSNPGDVDKKLKEFISSSPKGRYVISLEYDGNIPYGQYVETVDMIYNAVYSFRISLAEEKYGAPYDKLGAELQKEIRKVYPMALSESMK